MPIYEYECKCGCNFEKMLKISECSDLPSCPECGSLETHKLVTRSQVIFKGDGWVSKNLRVKSQMEAKNRKLGDKQKERHHAPSLVPNVNGERVDSWREAQKLAKSKGKDTASYEKAIRSEA